MIQPDNTIFLSWTFPRINSFVKLQQILNSSARWNDVENLIYPIFYNIFPFEMCLFQKMQQNVYNSEPLAFAVNKDSLAR